MIDDIIKDAKIRMGKAIDIVRDELVHIRTGKATTALVDGIKVDSYGQQMPLNQVATIAAPEARLITIQPWDKSLLQAVEKAIMQSELGLNPTNDGTTIRLAIPQLTEERRKELVKLVHKFGEDGKIAIRNIRRDANDHLKKMEKNKEIREDEQYRAQEEVQKLTDESVESLDTIIKAKDEEIMTV